jgi:hypothetical protein
MFLDRNITIIANYFLDHLCPPILRDCKWFMYPIMSLAYGKETRILLDFKEKFPFMSEDEIAQCYQRIISVPINAKRKTDINKQCLRWIINSIAALTSGGGAAFSIQPAAGGIC